MIGETVRVETTLTRDERRKLREERKAAKLERARRREERRRLKALREADPDFQARKRKREMMRRFRAGELLFQKGRES